MRRLLHILTRQNDPLAAQLIRWQKDQPKSQSAIVDLTRGEVDYDSLLDQIFDADSVQVF